MASTTSDRILDIAERLVQTQGFNGFSYADIADELHITKASLHYHFASKAKLGVRLVTRYTEGFAAALRAIDANDPEPGRALRAYAKLYEDVLRKNRMCLCGMLAADHATLSKEMRDELRIFFDLNEHWLCGVLERGRVAGMLEFAGSPVEQARLLLGALEGAMLVARSYGEVARFTSVATRLLSALDSDTKKRSRRRRPSPA